MPIKFKIEKQFLYLVMKALRAKNDQVLHAIIKKLNDFLLFFILFTWKLNQLNSFILLPSWSKSTITDWKNH